MSEPLAPLLAEIAALPLGTGEREALQLTLREGAVLLCDDLRARRHATARGLTVKGTLGVLMQAHRSGHLPFSEAEFLIQEIKSRDDIWIAPDLCERVLQVLRAQSADSTEGSARQMNTEK